MPHALKVHSCMLNIQFISEYILVAIYYYATMSTEGRVNELYRVCLSLFVCLSGRSPFRNKKIARAKINKKAIRITSRSISLIRYEVTGSKVRVTSSMYGNGVNNTSRINC